MKFICLLWAGAMLLAAAPRVMGNAGDNGNAQAFKALCAIYRLAEEIAGQPVLNSSSDTSTSRSVAEIERFFILTSDDEYFEEGHKPPAEPKETPDEKKDRLKSWKEKVHAMMEEKIIRNGNELGKYIRPPKSLARSLAHKKITLISEQAKSISENIERMMSGIRSKQDQVRTLARGAIFGEGQTEVDDKTEKTFSNTYALSCGGPLHQNAGNPGKSLANDIVCLCVHGDNPSGSANKACGSHLASVVNGKQFDGPANGAAAWKALEPNCPRAHIPETKVTGHEIAGALAGFRALVGGESTAASLATSGFENILGNYRNAAGCTGDSDADSNEKSCVSYAKQLQHGKGFDEIPWYAKMLQIIHHRQEIAADQSELHALRHRLAHLVDVAHQTFIDAESSATSQSAANGTATVTLAATKTDDDRQKEVKQGALKPLAFLDLRCVILGLVSQLHL